MLFARPKSANGRKASDTEETLGRGYQPTTDVDRTKPPKGGSGVPQKTPQAPKERKP